MSKDSGGWAFPIPGFEYLDDRDAENPERVAYLPAPGMTLRDYAAIHATDADVQAHAVYKTVDEVVELSLGFKQVMHRRVLDRAASRYAYADAMLAERAKPQHKLHT